MTDDKEASRQRIALFLPSLAGGGAEKIAITLATGFANRGYPTDLILAKAEGAYLSQVPQNIRVIDLCASRPLTAVPGLAKYLIKEKPTALLSKLTNSNIAALFASQFSHSKTRCIVCEESTLSIDLKGSSYLNKAILPILLGYLYRRADAVVAVSKGSANDIAHVLGLQAESIHQIYNPIVSKELKAISQKKINHPWLLKKNVPIILGIGRLTPQKDFQTLIQAFSEARKKIPCRLIILGEGEEKAALEQLSKDLNISDDIDFPGFVKNPLAFLSRADLFVLSSRWEGLGNVLVEALAVGTPVISTNCPNGPFEILEGGKYGQLIPMEDSKAMAEAIIKVLSGDFAAAPWEKKHLFNIDQIVEKYLELLTGAHKYFKRK